MYIEKVDRDKKELLVAIPLTTTSGKVRIKQRAVGIQPMLYFCFPITELITNKPLIGRSAKKQEFAYFKFEYKESFILKTLVRSYLKL